MDVKDRLSGGSPIIEDQTIPFGQTKLRGELCSGAQHFADKLFIVGLNEGRADEMFFGDDQKMDWRLGVDIMEGEAMIVFIDRFYRYLTGNHLAEKAMFTHGVPSVFKDRSDYFSPKESANSLMMASRPASLK